MDVIPKYARLHFWKRIRFESIYIVQKFFQRMYYTAKVLFLWMTICTIQTQDKTIYSIQFKLQTILILIARPMKNSHQINFFNTENIPHNSPILHKIICFFIRVIIKTKVRWVKWIEELPNECLEAYEFAIPLIVFVYCP